MTIAEKLPFHYGWLVVFACGTGMFIIFPQVFTVPGIYVVAITEDLGIIRTVHALSVTLQTLMSALAAALLSPLLGRCSAKWVMVLTALLLGVNLLSYALLKTVAGLFVRAAINGVCTCLAGNIIMTVLLQRWFAKSVNFAMSLAFTCTGLGGMVFSQVLSRVLVSEGWRVCYVLSGITVLCLVVPAYALLLRDSPEAMGLRPFGAETLDGVSVEGPADAGITLAEAKRRGYFYAFLAAIMTVNMASGITQNHFPPSLYDSGYAVLTVAAIQSLYSVLNSATKLSVGVIFDRIGPKIGLFIVVMGYAVGYWALAFAGAGQWLGYLAGTGFGIGIAWGSLGLPFVISSLFGRRDYAAIYGFCSMLTQFAAALAGTGAGLVYDLWGSYFAIWLLFAAGCAAAFGVFLFGLNRPALVASRTGAAAG